MVKCPSCSFTEQLFFHSCKWLLLIIYLINKCDKKLGMWKINTSHHIPEEKLKQLGLWNYCLIFSNVCCVVCLASLNALQYRLKIFSGATRINADRNGFCFFLIIWRSSEIKHSLKMWLSDKSWLEIMADFSKTAEK